MTKTCLAIVALTLVLAPASAQPIASLSAPGKAVSGAKELPAEIRAICNQKGSPEIDFVVTFKTIAEADAFFPLSTYEGPDGKAAPMQVLLTRAPKPITFNFKSAAGWFGVKNDYLLSLRPSDTVTFLRQGSDAASVSVTIVQGAKKLSMTFDKPGEVLGKLDAACRK